ncbi:alpha/beta hydrolase [Dyadobacter arcticus]|nr:alpha/beta hydrolase family protein [Dyadobacter arcticus]
MKKELFRSLILFLFICSTSQAAVVDTVDTYSAVMKKTFKTVVIKPDNYASLSELPVVYLLHGHGGNYANWVKNAAGFQKAADFHNILIVCPDGGIGSWYWDSSVDPQSQYETYIAKELVAFVDSKYKTIKSPKGRGITGLSMGGHGALYLALRHQDIFGAAGSMSGGVDIRPFPNNWDMAKKLGKYADQPERWEQNTVINMLHLLTPNALAIIIDCGTDDFFIRVNENLHEQLMYRNIPHDYIVRPGAHNWNYWTNAVQYQLLFMSNYFSKK